MAKGDVETYMDNGAWKNRIQGQESFETKRDAVAAGRKLAKALGVEHFIRNKDGTIGERNTYPRSRDPRETPG